MKLNVNDKILTLRYEINALEDKLDQEEIKNYRREQILKYGKYIVPVMIGGIVCNLPAIIIGSIISALGVGIEGYKDYKTNKEINECEEQSQYDYLRENIKEFLQTKPTYKKIKYSKDQKSGVFKKENELSKEEVKVEITDELERFNAIYDLPKFEIEIDDWDIFFDELYSLFENHNMKELYYKYMSGLQRFALAYILVFERDNILINDYIAVLPTLEGNKGSENTITTRDILETQKKIIDNIKNKKNNKIYDITAYKKRKK